GSQCSVQCVADPVVPRGEGSSCTFDPQGLDDCAAPAHCYEGVCRRWCDGTAQGDTCIDNQVCTFIDAGNYLHPIGVCL
ncbi:MAG TPA: hypothetical protein VL172_05510, partial [Kofleriaceae bacterium]|nr:hypothetical protein [Kofleriaceae bacterium]